MKNTQSPGKTALVILLGLLVVAVVMNITLPTTTSERSTNSPERVYFADNITSGHQRLIDRFNELHAGQIEVVPVNLPFAKFSTNERKQLLARSLRSRSTRIDVFAVDQFWVPRFTKWSEPLAPYFSPAELERIIPQALETCYFEKELVAMPLYLDIGIMYYRRDILRRVRSDFEALEQRLKASITWEEFRDLGAELSAAGYPHYVFPADNYEGLLCSFVETLHSQQAPLLQDDRLNLLSPEAVRGVQLLVDLATSQVPVPPLTEFKEIDGYLWALENDAVFVRGWPGNMRAYRRTAFADKVENLGVAALPHFRGRKRASVFGGWNLMVSKFSTKKGAAIAFLKFVTSAESQAILHEEAGYLPSSRSVYEDTTFVRRFPRLAYLRTLFANGFHRPAVAEYTRMSDITSFYIKRAIRKELPVRDALQAANTMIRSRKVLID